MMAYDPEKMDAAAVEAGDEWEVHVAEVTTDVHEPTAFDLVRWLRKHRGTAGYKRLCKWLFEYYGV